MEYQSFQGEAIRFLDHLFLQINAQIFPDQWSIDHLCFRTETDDDYERHRHLFKEFGELLIESEVGGRLISTFRLFEPVVYGKWQIYLLELPAPKKGKNTRNGFEHIEVVCNLPFNEIKSIFPDKNFSESGLGKDINRELEMELDGCAVKFHHLSLSTVIQIEKNEKVFRALMDSQILKTYRGNDPFVLEDGKTILLYGPDEVLIHEFDGVKFCLKFQNCPVTQQLEFKKFQERESAR